MNRKIYLLLLLVGMFHSTRALDKSTVWNKMITSKHYSNTKLVSEATNPFPADKISKESWARTICSKACANNKTCLGFNLFPNNNQYVCEYLAENFCSSTKRIALQAWPGGTVWDKISSGMTKACIEQKFTNIPNTTYCDVGRYGCRSTWPNCDTCVKTCNDCRTDYGGTSGLYECTLWPEGPFRAPIFGFCDKTATFIIKRAIDKSNGSDRSRYFMPLFDMYRLSKLRSYKSMVFNFQATDGTKYSPIYQNFAIDSKGTLMNMTYKSGSGLDGFNLGGKPLKPSPFVRVSGQAQGNCGSFWYLNWTQSLASLDCPGGGVGMLGASFDWWSRNSRKSGIRWPQAQLSWKTLIYADIKLDV